MRESTIQTQIRLALGAIPRVLVVRRTVGTLIAVPGAVGAAVALLRRHGFAATAIEVGTPGEADLQGIVGGQRCSSCGAPAHPLPFGVEVKTDAGRLSAVQVNWRDNVWTRRGGLHVVARSANEALQALGLLEGKP